MTGVVFLFAFAQRAGHQPGIDIHTHLHKRGLPLLFRQRLRQGVIFRGAALDKHQVIHPLQGRQFTEHGGMTTVCKGIGFQKHDFSRKAPEPGQE